MTRMKLSEMKPGTIFVWEGLFGPMAEIIVADDKTLRIHKSHRDWLTEGAQLARQPIENDANDFLVTVMPTPVATTTPVHNPPPYDKKFLLWCPTASEPPTKVMSEKQAKAVAYKMAEKNPGQQFYICELIEIIEVEKKVKVSKP